MWKSPNKRLDTNKRACMLLIWEFRYRQFSACLYSKSRQAEKLIMGRYLLGANALGFGII
jgi:hypothetical protein